jgi:hypothetical protein
LCCEYRVIVGASVYFPSQFSGTNANIYRQICNRQHKMLSGRFCTTLSLFTLFDPSIHASKLRHHRQPCSLPCFSISESIVRPFSSAEVLYATLQLYTRLISVRLRAPKYVPKYPDHHFRFPLPTRLATKPSTSWFRFVIAVT